MNEQRRDKRLIAYRLYEWDVPLVPAPVQRDWMSATHQAHAYHCLPLDIANQSGWLLLCTYDFVAVWNGRNGKKGVEISYPDGHEPEEIYATSHFGHGIITFHIPYLFRTPAGYNLTVRGPANYIRRGVQALEGVVETDWAPMTFTMNWKITIPDYPVTFRKGEPFCMISPQKRGELEQFEPEIMPLEADPQMQAAFKAFAQKRRFNYVHNALRRERIKEGLTRDKVVYDHDYMHGHAVDSEAKEAEHQTRLRLKPFRRGS